MIMGHSTTLLEPAPKIHPHHRFAHRAECA
jgi:hypothetical protein